MVTFAVLTTAVLRGYAPVKFLSVAVWELVGALLTGLALSIESDDEDRS